MTVTFGWHDLAMINAIMRGETFNISSDAEYALGKDVTQIELRDHVNSLLDDEWVKEQKIAVDGVTREKNPEQRFTPDQFMYAMTSAMSWKIKDGYDQWKNLATSPEWRGKVKGDEFSAERLELQRTYERHLDNTMGWLMENAPRQYVIFWARVTLAIFRVTFRPETFKHWERFSDEYQDLILDPARQAVA